MTVSDSTTWGKDISAMDTFLRDADRGLYNLYVVDPSAKQILRYSPAADGSGFPAAASDYLAAPQDVSGISSLYIDGALWAIDGTDVARFSGGQRTKVSVADPGDELLRPGTAYGLVTGYGSSSDGTVYAWDRANRRIVATDKATGAFLAQYRLADEPDRWDAITGMYVVDRGEAKPPLLYWTDDTRIWTTALDAVAAPGTRRGQPGRRHRRPHPPRRPRSRSPRPDRSGARRHAPARGRDAACAPPTGAARGRGRSRVG